MYLSLRTLAERHTYLLGRVHTIKTMSC
jgi:hypothetical protein